VSLQITLQTERHITHITAIRKLPTMYAFMGLQIIWTIKVLHTSQQYDCSPLWMYWVYSYNCMIYFITHIIVKWPLPTMKALMSLQIILTTEWLTTHITLNGCSPLWMHLWAFRPLWQMNDILHTSQQKGRSPLCMCWWIFKVFWWLNDLLQTLQQ
jgi:hypothetical protein